MTHIKEWISKTICVDIDVGEIITKHNAEMNYIKLKTKKKSYVKNGKGYNEYIQEYTKKGKQTKLFNE